jgi:hypothetical protein
MLSGGGTTGLSQSVFQSNSGLNISGDSALTGVHISEKGPHKSLGTAMFGGIGFDQPAQLRRSHAAQVWVQHLGIVGQVRNYPPAIRQSLHFQWAYLQPEVRQNGVIYLVEQGFNPGNRGPPSRRPASGVYIPEKIPHKSLATAMFGGVDFDHNRTPHVGVLLPCE